MEHTKPAKNLFKLATKERIFSPLICFEVTLRNSQNQLLYGLISLSSRRYKLRLKLLPLRIPFLKQKVKSMKSQKLYSAAEDVQLLS